MSELKQDSCPFCGSDDISAGEVLTGRPDATNVSQSECQNCGALGPAAPLEPHEPDYGDVKAIAAWNRRTQPEATKPAQDLGAAIPDGWQLVPKAVTREMQKAYFDVIDKNMPRVMKDARFGRWDSHREAYKAMLAAALASPADALVAGDRVDVEPLCFIDPYRAKDLAGGENVLTTLTVNRAFPEDVALYSATDYLRDLQKEFDAYMNDSSAQLFKVSFDDWRKKRAAIQAQKDGHG